MVSTGKAWHTEVLSSATEETLQRLSALETIRNFFLAGGNGSGSAPHFQRKKEDAADFLLTRGGLWVVSGGRASKKAAFSGEQQPIS
jgi:hypothetical protein